MIHSATGWCEDCIANSRWGSDFGILVILYPPIVLLPSLGFHEEVVGWKSTHWPGIKVKEEDEELVVLVLWSSLRVRPVTVGESFLCDVMVARCHIMLMTWFHPVKDKALYLSYLEREKHAHDVLFWRLQAASCGLGCIDSLLVLLLSFALCSWRSGARWSWMSAASYHCEPDRFCEPTKIPSVTHSLKSHPSAHKDDKYRKASGTSLLAKVHIYYCYYYWQLNPTIISSSSCGRER